MDLICIARKYRNIRRTILLSFIIMVFVYSIFTVSYVSASKKNDKIISNYISITECLKQNTQEIAKNKQILTQEGIENLKQIYKAETKQVFLTFDDGPSKKVTIPILDLLKSKNIKATFFVLGSRVELYPEIIKRAYDEGHCIANHGYSHKYSQIYNSANSVLEEYNKTNQAVKNAVQNQEFNTNIFRFPGGSVGGKYQNIKTEAKKLLEENNIATVDWNALTGDTEGLKTEEELLNRLKETTQNKTSIVILMHDSGDKSYTYDSLPKVIQYLEQEGYKFRSLNDII
jgi:peptidoglycan/xylan/chitin deacetylase (PgdA/CDA1 family)